MRVLLASLAVALSLQAGAAAAADAAADARFASATLDVSGHGEMRLAPDMATIDLGVAQRAALASDAMSQAAAAMAHVLAALKARGIDARDIRTAAVSLSPQYVYAQGQPPRLTGYEADNQLTVTVEDLARLGPVVDAVVNAGASSVGQVQFGLKNPAEAESLARLAAIKAMEDKAQAYATAAGYRIRRLVNLSETGTEAALQPRPGPLVMAAARVQPTPVEPGELTVGADVSGEFELTR
jgi:uncharacterized protein YggE